MSRQGRASSFCRLSVSAIKMLCCYTKREQVCTQQACVGLGSTGAHQVYVQTSSYKELDRAQRGTWWRERHRPCPHGAWILGSQSGKFTICMLPLITLLKWQYSKEQTSGCQGTARGEMSPRGAARGPSVMMNRLHLGCGGDEPTCSTKLHWWKPIQTCSRHDCCASEPFLDLTTRYTIHDATTGGKLREGFPGLFTLPLSLQLLQNKKFFWSSDIETPFSLCFWRKYGNKNGL